MERAMGIEPTSKAWEAYDITQKHAGLAAFLQFSERLNWKIMENGKRADTIRPQSGASGLSHFPAGIVIAEKLCGPWSGKFTTTKGLPGSAPHNCGHSMEQEQRMVPASLGSVLVWLGQQRVHLRFIEVMVTS
jgi:hypothetical protein